jgi:hypothetical protein
MARTKKISVRSKGGSVSSISLKSGATFSSTKPNYVGPQKAGKRIRDPAYSIRVKPEASAKAIKGDYLRNIDRTKQRAKENKAAKTLQHAVRNYNYKKGGMSAVKQGISDAKRSVKTEYKKLKEDAGYRKKVLGNASSSLAQGVAKSAGGLAAKVGSAALALYGGKKIYDKTQEEEETK